MFFLTLPVPQGGKRNTKGGFFYRDIHPAFRSIRIPVWLRSYGPTSLYPEAGWKKLSKSIITSLQVNFFQTLILIDASGKRYRTYGPEVLTIGRSYKDSGPLVRMIHIFEALQYLGPHLIFSPIFFLIFPLHPSFMSGATAANNRAHTTSRHKIPQKLARFRDSTIFAQKVFQHLFYARGLPANRRSAGLLKCAFNNNGKLPADHIPPISCRKRN